MTEVKKALILAGGLSTRFLPLSKVTPKELWPLVDKPIIHYLVEELKASGINQAIFVLRPDKRQALSYFGKDSKLEKILKSRKKEQCLMELENLKQLQDGLTISFVFQPRPLGDGHAILQAKEKIKKAPFVVLLCDGIVEAKIPATSQLLKVFKTCQRPIVALARTKDKEQTSPLETVVAEKIAHRLFKIKKIVGKPLPGKESAELTVIGKYILTPEVFDYLSNQEPNVSGGIVLNEALENLLKDGKVIYGYEIEGTWLPCGDKFDWLKSHLWLSLKHPRFGTELKKYLKQIM